MKKIKVTIKLYPVKERSETGRWSENQRKKRMTVKLDGKPDEEIANEAFVKLLDLGFGALDFNTHTKDIDIEDLNIVQSQLFKIFDVRLVL